jgi:hypothetical protein
VPKIVLAARNRSNVSIQIKSINDVNKYTSDLTPIRYRGNLVWGDPIPVWGDPTIVWGDIGLVEESRYFNGSALRCSYKQVELTNAYVIITNSDAMCQATVDSGLKTVTLNDATMVWPINLIGYKICFSNDNYTKEFEISSRSDTTLVVIDPTSNLVTGSYKWYIKGYPKEEVLDLLSYTVMYAYLGETQDRYTAAESGANA